MSALANEAGVLAHKRLSHWWSELTLVRLQVS